MKYTIPEIPAAWFTRPDGVNDAVGIHGVAHAARVWVNATELAAALGVSGWELDALQLAACWHDIG